MRGRARGAAEKHDQYGCRAAPELPVQPARHRRRAAAAAPGGDARGARARARARRARALRGAPGAQAAAFRAYDREEERAADRWAAQLLNRLPGDGTRCRALVALLQRLEREGQRPEYFNWLSTHPSPGARLQALAEECP